MNKYGQANNLLKENKNTALSGEDVREGLTVVISVHHPHPSYKDQPKTDSFRKTRRARWRPWSPSASRSSWKRTRRWRE